jgi:hypothetical protein
MENHMKTMTNIVHPAIALFAFGCFALSPSAQGVPPGGTFANGNTAEGTRAHSRMYG